MRKKVLEYYFVISIKQPRTAEILWNAVQVNTAVIYSVLRSLRVTVHNSLRSRSVVRASLQQLFFSPVSKPSLKITTSSIFRDKLYYTQVLQWILNISRDIRSNLSEKNRIHRTPNMKSLKGFLWCKPVTFVQKLPV